MNFALNRCAATAARGANRQDAFRARPTERMAASVATVVLAALTGLPARSAANLLPHPDDRSGPFLGM